MTVLPLPTSSPGIASPVRQAGRTLAEQIAENLARRISDQGLRQGTRLPSIRQLAQQCGVSRFTAVEAYDRLVAAGLAQSRRGAGFYVLAPAAGTLVSAAAGPVSAEGFLPPTRIDVGWLLRSAFSDAVGPGQPGGAGLLPGDWLDADMVAAAVRAVGRSARASLLSYGHQRGYAPLRQQISARLQADGILAHPERNLMTTAGVTQGIDLIARHVLKPGDTVLVEEPAWFVIFGSLAAFGVRVVGVPRGPRGPDPVVLEAMAIQHKPKLFIVNGAVHNPTGYSMSAGAAYDVLRIAERFDFLVVEDDTYGDLHPGGAVRLAQLDGLRRVIHVGGYSKMLAASLRVGYLAAAPELVQRLSDLKTLAGLTSPELGERVVHRVLAGGQYRRHIERVRQRVDLARQRSLKALLELGVRVDQAPDVGMFVWGDCGRDTEVLARCAAEKGVLLAPGSLFSPSQALSTYMRFSVALADNPQAWKVLRELLSASPRRA